MATKRQKDAPAEEPPRLTRTRSEARERIKEQIAKGSEILHQRVNTEADIDMLSGSYDKWTDFNKELLRVLFSGNRILKEYDRHRYISYQMAGGIREKLRYNLELTRGAIAELESLEQRLDLIPEAQILPVAAVDRVGLHALVKLLNAFHRVARQLRFRRENRPTLEIQDEYDVQDLLHALLKIEFSDVRPEEWTPSYAGKSSRTDFLLKNEKIVVETKKTRNVTSAKNVGDELIIDISRYRGHPDCETLVCFVYDPEGFIQNPEGLRNDLEGNSDSLKVRVVIGPKLH
jgi:hypothetical protein